MTRRARQKRCFYAQANASGLCSPSTKITNYFISSVLCSKVYFKYGGNKNISAWKTLLSHTITASLRIFYLTYHQDVVQGLFAIKYIKSSNECIS